MSKPVLAVGLALIAVGVVGLIMCPSCAWDFQAHSDANAMMGAGRAIADVGKAVGGPLGWSMEAVGGVVAGAGGLMALTHKLGKAHGREEGWDQAVKDGKAGATP